MSNKYLRTAFLLLISLFLFCAGCVQADVQNFVKYENKTDSFRCLQTYGNIHATDKKDLDHLAYFYEHRKSIIIQPYSIFTTQAFERKGTHRYTRLEFSKPTDYQQVNSTTVDLDNIKIMPGEFYLNKHGNLSFFMQCRVPGKTLDEALVHWQAVVAKNIEEAAKEDINTRNGRRIPWESVRMELVEELCKNVSDEDMEKAKQNETIKKYSVKLAEYQQQKEAKAKAQEKSKKTEKDLLPFEPASLLLLSWTATHGTFHVARNKDVFTFIVPLTKKDCLEIIEIYNQMRELVSAFEKAGIQLNKADDYNPPDLLSAIKLRYLENLGLEAKVNLTTLQQNRWFEVNPQPTAQNKLDYQITIADMRARGIKIKDSFALEKVLKKYVGKLPVKNN